MEAIIRLNDAAFDIDRIRAGIPLRLDSDQWRLVTETFYGEEVRLKGAYTDEIRVARSQPDVIERCELLADVG